MKRQLAIITKAVIYLMASAVIVICGILLPELAREEAVGKVNPPIVYPYLLGAWIISAPVFIALHQTHRLITFIDAGLAFSNLTVKTLQNIKTCALLFSALIAVGAVTVIILARIADPREDVTHIITLSLIFIFVSTGIATFIAVLQKLLREAVDIKTENDLTI